MNKNIILIIIILAIVGVSVILFAIISNASKSNEVEAIEEELVEEEAPVPKTDEEIFQEVMLETGALKQITDDYKIQNQTLDGIYDDNTFREKIYKIKSLGPVSISTNFSSGSLNYCVLVSYKEEFYCVDNEYQGLVSDRNCSTSEATCIQKIEEEIEEEIIVEEEEEAMEILIIPEVPEEPVEEIVEEPIVEEPVIEITRTLIEEFQIGNTKLERYRDTQGIEYILINTKEYGPYSDSYITTFDDSWGIGCKYNEKWYININGKVYGPYEEKPIIEIFEENLGFYYLANSKYYINIKGAIYGPYDDLLDFNYK